MKDFVIIELSSKATAFYYHRDNADGGLSLKKGETDQQVLISAGADAVAKSAVQFLGNLFYGDKAELPVVVTFGIDVEDGNRSKVVDALRSNGYANTVELDFDSYLFRSLHVSSNFAVVLSDNGRDAYARVFDLKHPDKIHPVRPHAGKGVDPRVQIVAKKMWESISQGEKYMLNEAKDMETLRRFATTMLQRDFFSPEIAESVVLSDDGSHDVFFNMDDVNRLSLEDKAFFKSVSKQIDMEGVDVKSCEVIIRDASCGSFWKDLFSEYYVQTMSEQKRMDVFELMADDAKAQEFDMLSFDKAIQAKREAEKKKHEAEEAKTARKKKEEEEKTAREIAEKEALAKKQQQEEALKAEQAKEAAKQQEALERQQEDLRKQQEELKKQQEELKKQKEKDDVKVVPPVPDNGTQPSKNNTFRNLIILLLLLGGAYFAYNKFAGSSDGPGEDSYPQNVDYTSIVVDKAEVTLKEGEVYTIGVTGEPQDANEKITWTTDNNEVAEVNAATGMVTARKAGHVEITATTERSGQKVTVKFNVKPVDDTPMKYTSISASPSKITLNVGEGRQIQLNCTPTKAKEVISWASDNSNVATVTQNGYITAKAAGQVNIIAVGEKSGVQTNVHVNVNGDSAPSSGGIRLTPIKGSGTKTIKFP